MLWFGEAMIDVALGAGVFEGMRPDRLTGVDRGLDVGGGRAGVAGRGEVGSVVGQHRVHLVGYGGDEAAQEVSGGAARDLFVQFDKGELGGPVDGHQEIELALSGMDLGDINMEVAERIGLELALARLLALDVRQPGHAMALQAAMQRGAGQVGDRGLQGIEAVIQRQQGMAAEGDDDGLVLRRQAGGLCHPGPGRQIGG